MRTQLRSVQDTGSAAAPSRTPPPTTTCRSTAKLSHVRGLTAASSVTVHPTSAAYLAAQLHLRQAADRLRMSNSSAPRKPDEVVGDERPRHHQRVAGRGQQHRAQRHPLQAGRHRKVAELQCTNGAPRVPKSCIFFRGMRRHARFVGSLVSELCTVAQPSKHSLEPWKAAVGH